MGFTLMMSAAKSARFGLALVAVGSVGALDQANAQDGPKYLTLQGVSSATVAPSGTGFGSITGTLRQSGPGPDTDGSVELGFGLGNAEDSIGVQVSASITSVTDSFGDSGYLSLKFSRRIAAGKHPTYVSVEGNQLVNWGEADDVDARAKIAFTTFGLTRSSQGGERYPYMLTIGAGNDLRNDATDPAIFLGAGIGLSQTTALSAAWTGEAFDVGVSFRPRQAKTISFNASVNDVTDLTDNRRVTLSVSWAVAGLFGG